MSETIPVRIWNYILKGDTFPQRQLGQLWDLMIVKVAAFFGLANIAEDWWLIEKILEPANALTRLMVEAAAFYARS